MTAVRRSWDGPPRVEPLVGSRPGLLMGSRPGLLVGWPQPLVGSWPEQPARR
ncbi:hypothetical protein ABZZ79_23430 [Streptomyces sp. NPDC006458]|uniref:hypothetical protein n=1 Tax=Streptomyces sp. NPDC006458 TaxID=3154302 RepID=UPI0033A995DF